MAVDLTGLVGGALGGAVVTSIVSPLVTQRMDRRQLRAAALRGVGAVERARWGDVDWEEFRKAVVELRSAALVGGAGRELTERYLLLAQVARHASDDAIVLQGDLEGGIPKPLAELVHLAAAALVDHLWHPLRTRPLMGLRIKRLDRAREATRSQVAHVAVPRVRWDVHAIS
jgi:hypothetical protein